MEAGFITALVFGLVVASLLFLWGYAVGRNAERKGIDFFGRKNGKQL